MKGRKNLSDYVRRGVTLTGFDTNLTRFAYYATGDAAGGYPVRPDVILLAVVGKFGTELLSSITAEHRRTYDHGWEAGRVWDRGQVSERLTKTINGGLWEVHQRLHEVPKLYDAIFELGYRGPAKYTSVFRAMTWMNDTKAMAPLAVADTLAGVKL